ncbi:hypothetical protein LQZ19_02910 [Treponema primitia]|uniref:SH3 domain-containing protein n=1 Tax=Treponema primitia TaxID=88058 RepID=UPI0039817965
MVKKIFYLLFFVLFVSCKYGFIKFDEYMENNIFNDKEILENEFYEIQDLEYKARMMYQEGGTTYNIYDNPNGKRIFFLKYWTRIIPIEIIKKNGSTWVKIETKEHNRGWVNSCFIELHR